MKIRFNVFFGIIALLNTAALTSAAPTASFQGLGFLPGGHGSDARGGVSGDGLVVVGWASTGVGNAFRWTVSTGMQSLGDLPGGHVYSHAWSISGDGLVVVGKSRSEWGDEAFRWTESEGMVGLGDLAGGQFFSIASAASGDGSVIVGRSINSSGQEAFRWTESEGMIGLGDLSGGSSESSARGISADGSVIVGSDWDVGAFRWTGSEGMISLGNLGGNSHAWDLSNDGSVIVGQDYSPGYYRAFRWTEATGMVHLGNLPSASNGVRAYATSGDGSIIVGGNQISVVETGISFIWDEENGMRNLNDVLEIEYGLDLTGWILATATGVSGDGLTIVGNGYNPEGYEEGWIARLPEIYNNRPVANAGADQTVFACVDGIVVVKLDGSGSYDADGDELEYFWFAGDDQIAMGVDPNVELSIGQHTIELIVNDGQEDSEPNAVVITVIGPVEADVHIVPRTINRKNRMKRVIAIIRLPGSIERSDISDEPFVLEPGGIEATWQRVIGRANYARVFASFDKAEVTADLPSSGMVELSVIGKLESGQCLYGADTVRIVQPRRRRTRSLRKR